MRDWVDRGFLRGLAVGLLAWVAAAVFGPLFQELGLSLRDWCFPRFAELTMQVLRQRESPSAIEVTVSNFGERPAQIHWLAICPPNQLVSDLTVEQARRMRLPKISDSDDPARLLRAENPSDRQAIRIAALNGSVSHGCLNAIILDPIGVDREIGADRHPTLLFNALEDVEVLGGLRPSVGYEDLCGFVLMGLGGKDTLPMQVAWCRWAESSPRELPDSGFSYGSGGTRQYGSGEAASR